MHNWKYSMFCCRIGLVVKFIWDIFFKFHLVFFFFKSLRASRLSWRQTVGRLCVPKRFASRTCKARPSSKAAKPDTRGHARWRTIGLRRRRRGRHSIRPRCDAVRPNVAAPVNIYSNYFSVNPFVVVINF
jgi:hypothetical protein